MEDVVMTDANEKSNQDNKEKENEIYTEFKKSLSLIDKSIILKDLKTLDINYRLINKFRRGFKNEDFAYLNEIYIKPLFILPSLKYDLSLPHNFTISPKALDKTKNSPEIIGYIFLIILTKLIDDKKYEEAFKGIEFLIDYFKKYENLTIKYLKAKSYYYLSLIAEILNKFDTIIKELHGAYYLITNNVDLARAFLSKTRFKENISTNEDSRYLFYIGRIEAIQMNYSEAFKHLTNSFRKAPEKTGDGFKTLVQKHIIVVQLLMGEIPDVNSLLNQNFNTFKPYLNLLKVVRHGNLDEFKDICNKYSNEFERDQLFTLIQRIRHVVIKAGLRKINLSYSRISIKDITEKLKLESEKEAEYIIAKAIRDGVFLAKINHDEGFVQSMEIKDIYSTFEPQRSYNNRILFLNKIYNDALQAMKYSEKQDETKKGEKKDLEEEDAMDRAYQEFQ